MKTYTTVDELGRAAAQLVMGECAHDFTKPDGRVMQYDGCSKCGKPWFQCHHDAKYYARDANHTVELLEKIGLYRIKRTSIHFHEQDHTELGYEMSVGQGSNYHVANASTFKITACLLALRSVGHECEYEPENSE